jgi:hypothetical protein
MTNIIFETGMPNLWMKTASQEYFSRGTLLDVQDQQLKSQSGGRSQK